MPLSSTNTTENNFLFSIIFWGFSSADVGVVNCRSVLRRKFESVVWTGRGAGRGEEPVLLGVTRAAAWDPHSEQGHTAHSEFQYLDIKREGRESEQGRQLAHIQHRQPNKRRKAENEIEKFERKFLLPLEISRQKIPVRQERVTSVGGVETGGRGGGGVELGGSAMLPSNHARVLRTDSKDSDCDSGAYSRSSSPEPSPPRCLPRPPPLAQPLLSPPLVLSVVREVVAGRVGRPPRPDPALLLSCLTEAGKPSVFASLDNLAGQAGRQAGPAVTVTVGRGTQLAVAVRASSETDLRSCSALQDRLPPGHHVCTNSGRCSQQVTVNGKHICNSNPV